MGDKKGQELSELDWDFVLEAAHGLPFTPTSGSVLSGGRINETWRIETSEGPLVLRRYPQSRRLKQIQFELSVVTHLAQRGCNVPKPLAVDTTRLAPALALHKKRLHSWFSYIDGRPIGSQNSVTPSELGALLLPVFIALRDFSPPFRPVAETHVFGSQAQPFLDSLPPPTAQKLRRVFNELVHWEQAQSLPAGVIHADIYPGNVLRDKANALWLIDFDDAHVGSRALDWIMAAAEFSFQGADLKMDRYETYLKTLRPHFAQALERESEPRLLQLLSLKSAINEHSLGTFHEENHYVHLLLQGLGIAF